MGIFKILIMNQLENIDIIELIPQRSPFLMIDKLVSINEVITKTTFIVHEDNIFYENGCFYEAGIIENIAQSCAARMGYINKYLNDDEVKLGFIGAVKNLNIHFFPTVGDKIETTVEVLSEYFNLTMVCAKSICNGKVMAECEMKISLV